MRIGTYNVHGLRGFPAATARPHLGPPDGARARRHFTQVLTSLRCDVLALPESATPAQMARLAAACGRYHVVLPSPQRWPLTVLAQSPLEDVRPLRESGDDPGSGPFTRAGGLVTVRETGRAPLVLIAVHCHPKDPAVRTAEAARILAAVDALGTAEVAVLGDFNAERDEALPAGLGVRGFVNAVDAAGGGPQPTRDTAGGRRVDSVDHIYLSPSLVPRLRAAAVVRAEGFRTASDTPDTWVHSDHLPVLADLGT